MSSEMDTLGDVALEMSGKCISVCISVVLNRKIIDLPCSFIEKLKGIILSFREEIAEAQRTNKPSGRCHYCLMISKTCKEPSKNIPARGGAPKEEYMFVNAEEEFFYEVNSSGLKSTGRNLIASFGLFILEV